MSGLTLLAPLGLIALIGLPLIVLFHMRHTTPLVQNVPSLRFWRLAMLEESEREQFRRPPITLFLLLHLLLVGLLALALTRPATSRALGGLGSRTEPRHLILMVDGSTSMSATTSSGSTRYQAALLAADSRLAELRQGDVATVLLMGSHPTTLEATDPAELRALRDRLQSLPLPGGIADLNGALKLSTDLLLPSMTDQIVVITDGAVPVDTAIVQSVHASIALVPVGDGATANVAITDLTTRGSEKNPGQQTLFARIRNFGPVPVTAPLVISADGVEVSRADVTVDPDTTGEEVQQELPAGAAAITVTYTTPDALPADNTASSILHQGSVVGLRILLASDVATPLQRALTVLPGAVVTTMSPAEAAATRTEGVYDLVVYEHSSPKGKQPDTPVLIVDPDDNGLLTTNGVMANPSVQTVLRARSAALRSRAGRRDLRADSGHRARQQRYPDRQRGQWAVDLSGDCPRRDGTDDRARLRCGDLESAPAGGLPDPDRQYRQRARAECAAVGGSAWRAGGLPSSRGRDCGPRHLAGWHLGRHSGDDR